MLTKLAAIVQSKIALGVLGAVLVGGSGTAVAVVAANPQLNPLHTSSVQPGDNHANQNADKSDEHAHTVSVEGVLKAYDANAKTISVLGEQDKTPTTIYVNDSTTVNGEHATTLADLAKNIGHKVEVSATKQQDDSLLAWKITVEGVDNGQEAENESADKAATPGASNASTQTSQHELSGKITSVDPLAGSFVLTLPDGSTKTVTLSVQTTFQGSVHSIADLKAGLQVTIQGTLQANGDFAATVVVIESSN